MNRPLLIDGRMQSGESVPGWPSVFIYGHDQFTLEPTKELVQQFAEQHSERLPVIIDLEHWPLPAQQDKYIEVVDWWREARPDLRIGYYSMVPSGNYWAAIIATTGDISQMKVWAQANAQLARKRDFLGRFTHRGLADVVDFVCPSLYMAYIGLDQYNNNHSQLWFDAYAPATIIEARKYQKQIYPFICPRVHPGNQAGDANKYIGDDLLREQIKWCIENTDGCIVWDYYLDPDATTILPATSKIMKEFS